jgi:hypothetical protein
MLLFVATALLRWAWLFSAEQGGQAYGAEGGLLLPGSFLC